ncbi:hypothetical protein HK405_001176, partial [Cladochytrium tenue]
MADPKDHPDVDRTRFRGAGLTEWDRFVEYKIQPALRKDGHGRFLEAGKFFAEAADFIDNQVKSILGQTLTTRWTRSQPGRPLHISIWTLR